MVGLHFPATYLFGLISFTGPLLPINLSCKAATHFLSLSPPPPPPPLSNCLATHSMQELKTLKPIR